MSGHLIRPTEGIKTDARAEVGLCGEGMSLPRLLLLVLLIRRGALVCRLQGKAQPPEFTKAGDFVTGGIFTFRTGYRDIVPTFQTLPDRPTCQK